jgi:hypothetical protein
MPSLFSRQRTTSTPGPPPISTADEFGRVGEEVHPSPQTPRKDTKYATLTSTTTHVTAGSKLRRKEREEMVEMESYESSLRLDDAGFYPFTSLPPVFNSSGSSGHSVEDVPYGHLAHKREIVLSIFQMSLLVEDIAHELTQRGLQVPFLFSSQAIDLNPAAVKRLIDSFFATCLSGGSREKWLEDKKFAGAHELGMVLRWGLARVMRKGERRGILDFDRYLTWRDEEDGKH